MNTVEKNLRKSIGKKIKLARTKSKYTQEQLAEKLSLSPRYITHELVRIQKEENAEENIK